MHPGSYEVYAGREDIVVSDLEFKRGVIIGMFNGGAASRLGGGGAVIVSKDEKVLAARGYIYGAELQTNNGPSSTACW